MKGTTDLRRDGSADATTPPTYGWDCGLCPPKRCTSLSSLFLFGLSTLEESSPMKARSLVSLAVLVAVAALALAACGGASDTAGGGSSSNSSASGGSKT